MNLIDPICISRAFCLKIWCGLESTNFIQLFVVSIPIFQIFSKMINNDLKGHQLTKNALHHNINIFIEFKNRKQAVLVLLKNVRIAIQFWQLGCVFVWTPFDFKQYLMEFSKQDKGVTSVRVNHAPGGKSNFSLAWDEPVKAANQPQSHLKKPQQEITGKPNQQPAKQVAPVQQQPVAAGKTSVKVHNPPGGKSSITFG